MATLRSWRALFVKEFIEHRISFQWVPLGILVLLTAAGASALTLHRVQIVGELPFVDAAKVFELGYLVLLALWLAYMTVSVFFYFGDAFSADRRNNAMLFWKSMPVTDLKILTAKALSGLVMFPLIVLAIGLVTGVVYFLILNIASLLVPALGALSPVDALGSFGQISLYALVYFFCALAWYAPFFAWVGALSTVVGRWSLPLAFVIPGMLAVMENVVLFGNGPRGGYVWNYISYRWNFALNEADYTVMALDPRPFNVQFHLGRLFQQIDWVQMGIGLAFAIAVIWLASEYRRRRIA